MDNLTADQRAENRKERNQAMKDFEQRFQDAVAKVAEIVRSVENPQFVNNPDVRKAVLEAAEKLVLLPGSVYDAITENYKDLI